MTLVELDERYRVTIPKKVRQKVKVIKGQKFYLITYGDNLLMKPVPMDAPERLDEIIGEFRFDKETRRKAGEWLLKQTRKKS